MSALAGADIAIISESRAVSLAPVSLPAKTDTVAFSNCPNGLPDLGTPGIYLCTTAILFDSTSDLQSPTLLIHPSNHSMVVRLNSHEIYRWGEFSDPVSMTNFAAVPIVLTSIQQGRNSLEVYLKSDGKIIPLPEISVGSYQEMASAATRQTLLNLYLIQAIGIIALFAGLFFFGYTASVEFRERDILYFSFFCFSIFLGYIHFIASGPTTNGLFWFKLSRIGYLSAATFLYLFSAAFTDSLKSKVWKKIIVSIGVIGITLCAFSADQQQLHSLFTLFSMLFLLPILFFCFGTLMLRSKQDHFSPANSSVLLGFTLFLCCTTYDILCVLRGVDPYFWTTPYGYFSIIAATVGALAFRYRHTHENVLRYKAELLQTNEDLNRTNLLLTEESEAKESFIKAIAHEFRTPLHGIAEIVNSLVEEESLSPSLLQRSQLLGSSFSRFELIVQNLLDYEAMLNNTLVIKAHRFSPEAVLKSAAEQFREDARSRGLELLFHLEGDFPKALLGDSLRTRLIVQNLLQNALKFTDEGGVSLHVSHRDGALKIEISDSGCGIPFDTKKNLFTAFSRGEETSVNQRYEGIGLGLSIVNAITNAMGGTISFESTLGTGTFFHISLPMEELEALEKAPGIKMILVVDDNEINRTVGQMQVQHFGYESVTACNGVEAVELVKKQHFDLVLMDVQMPVMNGLEATKIIKELLPNLPVIGLTANASRAECLAAGMSDIIQKPANGSTVQGVIRGYLS